MFEPKKTGIRLALLNIKSGDWKEFQNMDDGFISNSGGGYATQEAAMKKLMPLFTLLILSTTLCGCSVYMAAGQSEKKDLRPCNLKVPIVKPPEE